MKVMRATVIGIMAGVTIIAGVEQWIGAYPPEIGFGEWMLGAMLMAPGWIMVTSMLEKRRTR